MEPGGAAACAACDAPLPARSRFCPSCGTPAGPPPCASCGEPLLAGARFCSQCGAPAGGSAPASEPAAPAPVSERRVTSVLFGDLVGFTTLSESRDPEEVRELLSRYFAQCRVVIGRYGGTVEKFIGDAVMAVWGVPIAHEDDAERAVRAGLELVAMVGALGDEVGAAGLSMRVGVVTGEVAVTVGATNEGMVAGDAVNSASRVQSTASPGQVWVDDTTRSLTVAAITYEDMGEHSLKGKAEPMRLHAARAVVAAVGGGQRVDGLEAPHTGRDRELRLLKELFHAAEESRRPRLVVVDGEPGVGKSRLVWEFEKYIDGLTDTVRWHRGRCLSYGDGVAFWALSEAVRARLGLTEADQGELVAARLEAGLAQFVPDPGERDWLRPRLASLLGLDQVGGFAREDLFAAWTTFLERVGEGDHPVVLVVDDAQYADDGLLDFLDHLMATAQAAIFVLAPARPELLVRRHDIGGRRTTVIRLEPLAEDDMATLVDGLVVGLPTPARTALVERSEGIPLFAVETVRALIDRDLVVPRGGRYVLADPDRFDLDEVGAPVSLQALVAARLDALAPEERRLVADASVLGSTFSRDGLAAVSGQSDLEAALSSLQRKEIFSVQTDRLSAERGQLKFVQAVVRQVAYSTQSRRDRKLRHLAAADYLGEQLEDNDDLAVVVAQHLLDAIDASSSDDVDAEELRARAVLLLRRAASRATALGAQGEALRLLTTALARTDDTQLVAELELAAARAASDSAQYDKAEAHGRSAASLFIGLGDEPSAGLAATLVGEALISTGDNAAAVALCEQWLERLDGRADAVHARVRLGNLLAGCYQGQADWDRMGEVVEQTLVLAEGARDTDVIVHLHLRMGIRFLTMGAPVTAVGMYERAIELARIHDLPEKLVSGLNALATIHVNRDLEAALACGREGMAVGRRAGVVTLTDFVTFNYWLALWTAGRLGEARAILDQLRESAVDPAIRLSLPALGMMLAELDGTEATDGPPDTTSDNVSDLAWLAHDSMLRARAAGDRTRAAAFAEECLEHVLAAAGIDDDFMHLWPPMVRAALEADDVPLAERLLAPVEEAAPGTVPASVAALLPLLRGTTRAVRGDEPALVETELRESVAALDAFGAVAFRARAQEQLATHLAAHGRAAEAEELFELARTTYAEIGADGWLASLDTARVVALAGGH